MIYVYTMLSFTGNETRSYDYMKHDDMISMIYKYMFTELNYGRCDYRSQCLQISRKKPTVSIWFDRET